MTQTWHDQCTCELQAMAGFVVRTRFRPDLIRECLDQILLNHGRPDLVEREHDWSHLAISYLEEVGFQPHEAAEAVRVIGCPSSVIDVVRNSMQYGDPSRREWWVRDEIQVLKDRKYYTEHKWVAGKGGEGGHWEPNGETYLTEHQVRRQHEARRHEPVAESKPATKTDDHLGDALTGWIEEV